MTDLPPTSAVKSVGVELVAIRGSALEGSSVRMPRSSFPGVLSFELPAQKSDLGSLFL